MICLLQLEVVSPIRECARRHVVLSAREEAAWFRHLVAVLEPCAEVPGQADDEDHHSAYNSGVGFPIGGLGVPATSW